MTGESGSSGMEASGREDNEESVEKEWETVGAWGSPRKSSRKRRKNNTGGSENEDKEPEKEISLNVVVRFEGEGGVKKIEPLKLTKIIRAQVGEVKYARVLEDGNMLIGCNSEAQVEKAMKMNKIDKIKIIKVVRVGEWRTAGCKGVIYGISLKVNMSELV